MDEINVPPDNLGKRLFGAVAGVACEQLQVSVAHFQKYIAAGLGNPTKNFEAYPES